MRRWMTCIARRRAVTTRRQALGVLRRQLENYGRTPVMEFDEQAAVMLQRLRRAPFVLGRWTENRG